MPLHHVLSPAAAYRLALFNPRPHPLACALFHSTPVRRDDEIDHATNHYETLKLSPGATTAEIKKSFYALSKTHHPDHNRLDPRAPHRFMRISEAYGTLSSAEKRTAYDRDVLGLQRSPTSGHGRRAGSYSSTTVNPAGGRPATGLSRRRGAFTGPPPSFYRSGGWGAHGAKRGAAHEESTGSNSSSSARHGARDHHNDGAWAAGAEQGFGKGGGMGPGQDPFGAFAGEDDVPSHFDKRGHEATGRRTEQHPTASRRRRMVDGVEVDEVDVERSPTGMFFVVGGVLVLSFLGPFVISRAWNKAENKKSRQRVDGRP